jgi:hypothetical protein
MSTEEENVVKIALRKLGVNNSYLGFRYVVHCVGMVLREDELRTYIKVPYVDTAVTYHTTQKCVERNIRTLIEIAWNGGRRDVLDEIAGSQLTERPKSKAFIGMLADYVRVGTGRGDPEEEAER